MLHTFIFLPSLFFLVFSSSSSFFFFFFFPLTRPHEAEEWQSLPISTAISAGIGHIDLFRPYRHVSVAVSTVSVLVSTGIGVNRPHFGPNWHESGRVWVNQKKKRGGRVGKSDVGHCVGPHRTLVQRPWSCVDAF